MNEMLKLCIEQGYVPADCKLDGMLVWLLINEGKNGTGDFVDDDMKNIRPWVKAGHKAIHLEIKGEKIAL
mgnify:CR=1 FL=1